MSLKNLFNDLKEIIFLIEEQLNLEEDKENKEEVNLIVEPLENNESKEFDEPNEPEEIEETEEELEIIRKLIELYVNDILKKVDKVIIKEMTKEEPNWRDVVEDYLDLSKYKIKKFINDNNTKSTDEIVELLINL
jgi:hypothetical protein